MSSLALHQNGDCVDDIPVKQLSLSEYDDCGEVNVFPQLPSDCCDAGDKFGEPDILPRIGDEYQAELPPLIREPNHRSYSESLHHSLQDFFIGLPIPLIWISCSKNELDSRHPDYKNSTKMTTFCNGDIKPSHNSVKSEEEIKSEEKIRVCSNGANLLVPGLHSERWSDAEKASFLLALYIFEKNFVEVRRFVESKEMGAILSFYYGEFYGSDFYRRWSEGRKAKSKKCVYGQRIFSGLRQQELMSRLLHKVSEECKSELLKVSKTFSEDKMSLVDYVASLKAMVGNSLLVEAIAIGSGKQDLTGMALEPPKSNQATRSEIPAGKACSSLTTAEIIKFLSGDYRLSKARSNDLFWEAVWPRLLARGWHSEQPQYRGYIAGSKCLVFLLPGVKKFSRRKLVKGDHYFDSVTDVLSKVVKEPGLIELDDDEEGDGGRNSEWADDVKVEEGGGNRSPTRQRYSYLQPRTPTRIADAVKFTVVDTCLPDGKIRELRSLPREFSSIFVSFDAAEESNTMNSITVDASTAQEKPLTKKKHAEIINKPSKRKKDPNSNDSQKPRKASKSVSSRKQKLSHVADDVAPITKRCRRLSGNSNSNSNCNTHEEERDGEVHSTASRIENGTTESNENLSTRVGSSKGSSPYESSDVVAAEPQLLIDLNLPHVSPEFDNVGPASKQSMQKDRHGLPAPAAVESNRRLSTRNRPPTTRALEALASGYLTVSRRKRGRDPPSSVDAQLPSRPSQQPRRNESPSSSMASHIGEGEKDATTSGISNTGNKSDDPTEENRREPASIP